MYLRARFAVGTDEGHLLVVAASGRLVAAAVLAQPVDDGGGDEAVELSRGEDLCAEKGGARLEVS